MPKKSKTNKWTRSELTAMRRFVTRNSEYLVTNMYSNILAGRLRFHKRFGFFRDMNKAIKRTPYKCKSKFQKTEKALYTRTLGVSERAYDCFAWVRRRTKARLDREQAKKKSKVITKNWNLRTQTKIFKAKGTTFQTGHAKCAREGTNLDGHLEAGFEQTRSEIIAEYGNGELSLAGLSPGAESQRFGVISRNKTGN